MENERSAGTDHHDQDQEEEQKMEQFFALIRKFQEARNRRRIELLEEKEQQQQQQQQQKKKKMKRSTIKEDDHDQKSRSWVPCFELEDFSQEIQFKKPPALFFPSSNGSSYAQKDDLHKKQDQGQEDDGLTLKLAL